MSRGLIRAMVLCGALCVIGAVSAPPAFAAVGEFTFGSAPATVTGSQVAQNVFSVTNTAGSQVQEKCSVATFEGTSSVASGKDLTITPEYSNCTLGGLAATVNMNGCKYTLTGSAEKTALVDITGCTTGKTMTWVKGNCTIAIGEQSALAHITFTSEGTASTMDVLANLTITGIRVTQTGSECFAPGATQSDASWSGTVTFKAFSDSGSRSATKHEHTFTEVICGTQISFTMD